MQATALRRGSGADSGSTAARGEGRALALAAALPACSRDSATAPATAQESSDHMLFLDGVYLFRGAHPPLFHPVAGPSANELQRLVEQIAVQVGQALERRGLIERDIENAWLATDFEAGPLDDLIGYSITYRIAVGPKAGQRLFTMQTVPPRLPGLELDPNGAARAGGFSLHAGVDIAPHQCDKLKRLCRYISRPPVTSERLALTASGQVRYTLKTPYRDGTTHIVLEPLDLMARLAALVPPPRRRLTRFHGVFAPHSPLRAMVTPARWGRGAQPSPVEPGKPPTPRQVAMYWATRLKRVFRIEIDTCQHCGAWPMSWNGWRRSGWPNQPAASIIHWVAEDSPR